MSVAWRAGSEAGEARRRHDEVIRSTAAEDAILAERHCGRNEAVDAIVCVVYRASTPGADVTFWEGPVIIDVGWYITPYLRIISSI